MLVISHHISSVIVSVLDSHEVDLGLEPRSDQTNGYIIVFAVSPLSMQHYSVSTNTVWQGIRIMCPSGVTCLPEDFYFS